MVGGGAALCDASDATSGIAGGGQRRSGDALLLPRHRKNRATYSTVVLIGEEGGRSELWAVDGGDDDDSPCRG